jgi:hypothetical protein
MSPHYATIIQFVLHVKQETFSRSHDSVVTDTDFRQNKVETPGHGIFLLHQNQNELGIRPMILNLA